MVDVAVANVGKAEVIYVVLVLRVTGGAKRVGTLRVGLNFGLNFIVNHSFIGSGARVMPSTGGNDILGMESPSGSGSGFGFPLKLSSCICGRG